MSESDRPGETQWLRRVLDVLMRYRDADVSASLSELRDRICPLAWDESAPKAAAFASDGDGDRFRRHPLASVEAIGCSALLMYWPAGHATLPHDHDGLWGIEVVVDGQLDIDEFVKSEREGHLSLTHARSLRLGIGDAAMFSGSQYVHRCRNLSNIAPTLTLHIYGGALDAYTSFDRDAAGRVVAQRRITRSDRCLS